MTGNTVLLALAAVQGEARSTVRSVAALLGFAAGAAAGALIVRRGRKPERWPRGVTVVVVAEVVLLCGLAVAWAAGEAAPQGWSLLNLILLAAVTMGMQSAAVRSIGGAGITTTFITGTWADLVSGLMGLSGVTENRLRRAAAIATYVLGAALGGIVVIRLPPWTAPLLPAALLAVAASSAVLLLRADARR